MFAKKWRTCCHFLLIAGASLLLLMACISDSRTAGDPLEKYTFQGQYSLAGGPWLPLEDGLRLSALEGDLRLRGSFGCRIPEGSVISFYTDHLQYSIVLNGEKLGVSDDWDHFLQPSMCSRKWNQIVSPGIGPEDTLEIHLRNPHRAGNSDAYYTFLHSLYPGDKAEVQLRMGESYTAHRGVGMLVLGISFAVLGIALTFILMDIRHGKSIWTLGLLSFCMGAFIVLDTPDIGMVNGMRMFNTYGAALAVMMASLEMTIFLGIFLHGGARKVARGIMFAQCGVMAVMLLICLGRQVGVYDMMVWWMYFQFLISPVQIGCCIREISRTSRPRANLLISCSILLGSCMAELVNEACFLWPGNPLVKGVFLFLFSLHIVKGVRGIPAILQRATQAARLEKDLKDSQITMAMGQIRTHFVFNVLNAISGMCKYDPEKADMTVVRFSRYLRTNIDIMSSNHPVSFETALQYLEDYVVLEQIRFGDKIKFDVQIGAEDFDIPPLVLQPLVENAIKHGLTPKASGGTVTLRTWEDERNIYLTIEDDGVGCTPEDMKRQDAVGLKNVRFRLEQMMNGSLQVESVPGKGTTARITIPVEEVRKCM